MIGFLIGTVCTVALVGLLRHGFVARRHAFAGCGPACGPGVGYGPPWRARGRRRGGLLRALFEELDTTPGQEKAIGRATSELGETLRSIRRAKGAGDLAAALRADAFDESAAARFSVDAEEAFGAAKTAALDALRKVHEALDARQRARLADWIERRGALFGGPPGAGWV